MSAILLEKFFSSIFCTTSWYVVFYLNWPQSVHMIVITQIIMYTDNCWICLLVYIMPIYFYCFILLACFILIAFLLSFLLLYIYRMIPWFIQISYVSYYSLPVVCIYWLCIIIIFWMTRINWTLNIELESLTAEKNSSLSLNGLKIRPSDSMSTSTAMIESRSVVILS